MKRTQLHAGTTRWRNEASNCFVVRRRYAPPNAALSLALPTEIAVLDPAPCSGNNNSSYCADNLHFSVIMCFFDQRVWCCGFWRWGAFRQQCTKERRIGHTCGLKLVHEVDYETNSCTLCAVIARKRRRLAKMAADTLRWQQQERCPATVERTTQMMTSLEGAISTLLRRHELSGSSPRRQAVRRK